MSLVSNILSGDYFKKQLNDASYVLFSIKMMQVIYEMSRSMIFVSDDKTRISPVWFVF